MIRHDLALPCLLVILMVLMMAPMTHGISCRDYTDVAPVNADGSAGLGGGGREVDWWIIHTQPTAGMFTFMILLIFFVICTRTYACSVVYV